MNDINTYIVQARHAGVDDNEIRDNLVLTGWRIEDIDKAFQETTSSDLFVSQNPSNQSYASQPNDNSVSHQLPAVQTNYERSKSRFNPFSSLRNIIGPRTFGLLALILVIVAVVIFMFVVVDKPGYSKTAQKFISAIQDKNKTDADTLENSQALSYFKQTTGDSSFYDSCVQSGSFCTNFFKSIGNATKTVHSYTSSSGIKGKEITYTENVTAGGFSQKCINDSTTVLNLSLVPSGNTWLIDYANISINDSNCRPS
jgi:hypothetical protein